MTLPMLAACLQVRQPMMDARHETALRLFNGFLEGCPDLVVDLYVRTLVVQVHGDDPVAGAALGREAAEFYGSALPWLNAVVLKLRAGSEQEKRGILIFGNKADRKVYEQGAWYALDLQMHQDASLYLDTRGLRAWLCANLRGKSMLNTFAYTGSLGAAAYAGGASRVVQTDLERGFLNLAKETYTLNGFPIHKQDFIPGDFFTVVGGMKHRGERFDCVILDPPFFSTTAKGRVDLNRGSSRLINKVRPLIQNDGWLVVVNNAVYVSGQEYLDELTTLCADGYMVVEALVPVPEDLTGTAVTRRSAPPADPAPFNHSTKIAILRVRRKG